MEELTFTELGIPFPLFDAPAKFATNYVGEGKCSICRASGLCFGLGIGNDVLKDCERCGMTNTLPAYGGATHVTCNKCRNLIPINPRFHDAIASYSCLRNGRVSLTHDTVYGMVRYEDAVTGMTHGTPVGEHGDFMTSLNSDGWTQVHVPQEWLLELTRTPTYLTMQSESWEFCCTRPMVYIGEWTKADFDAHSPDGMGQRFFEDTVRDAEPGLWDAMWDGEMHDEFAIYMFYCPVCASHRGHWDMF